MGAFALKSYEFRREREASWHALEILVDRVERQGLDALSADELHQLPALYRAALSSLSVARAISLDCNVLEYLEALAARAYVCVYSAKKSGWHTALAFLSRGFPQAVWRHGRHLGLAIAVMLLGVACGFTLTWDDPERYYAFVDPSLAGGRGPTSSKAELEQVLYDQSGPAGGQLSAFASFLFSHNAKIGMMCYGLGFAAGVPVLLLLFTNGLMLGAMIAIHWQKGLGPEFIAWVMGHGVTELLAVCLCGAAGLAVGQALLFPGGLKRMDSMAQRGREAGAVVLGSVLLFFVAALIEGYFRQLVHGLVPRALMATGTAIAWTAYFLRGAPWLRARDADNIGWSEETAPRSVRMRGRGAS